MALSDQEIDRAFALIEQAAVKGERAPQCQPFGPLRVGASTALYRAGLIRGEIFAGNFRRFTILSGPHRGKATANPPTSGPPYRVLDQRTVATPRPARMGRPSAPRPLTLHELRKIDP
jgi:hypothetical protein